MYGNPDDTISETGGKETGQDKTQPRSKKPW